MIIRPSLFTVSLPFFIHTKYLLGKGGSANDVHLNAAVSFSNTSSNFGRTSFGFRSESKSKGYLEVNH